jgi:hypothetical protein
MSSPSGRVKRPSVTSAKATQDALTAVGDCVAAVMCCERADPAGLVAVLERIPNPYGSFGMLATITAGVLGRAGLHGDAAEKALREVAMTAVDGVLDHAAAGGE